MRLVHWLMSGTSLDGVDGVLADFSHEKRPSLATPSAPFSCRDLRAEMLALNTPGPNELHRAALAGNALARSYAEVVHTAGQPQRCFQRRAGHWRPWSNRAPSAPGVRRHGYTLQLNNPSLLAELTGIAVVADFRSRDVAAGGQGAPLVPAFHQGVFRRAGETVLVLNIGGISNLSVLGADGSVIGFDCGPGNALMDHWCQRHTGQAV
jgi:anhydro-N-acetylmuramic acid kinase